MPDKFTYFSQQIHSDSRNGTRKVQKNTVSIKNGKGYKEIKDGTGRHRRTLKKSEIGKIRKNIFICGLFKNCRRTPQA